jgi:hypothetical protein
MARATYIVAKSIMTAGRCSRPADEVQINTLGDWLGIEMKGPPATLHFAESLEVRAWLVERV